MTARMEASGLDVKPLHLTSPMGGGATLCGRPAKDLPTVPVALAYRQMSGPRCDVCFGQAGLSERGKVTRPRKPKAPPWEQLPLPFPES